MLSYNTRSLVMNEALKWDSRLPQPGGIEGQVRDKMMGEIRKALATHDPGPPAVEDDPDREAKIYTMGVWVLDTKEGQALRRVMVAIESGRSQEKILELVGDMYHEISGREAKIA